MKEKKDVIVMNVKMAQFQAIGIFPVARLEPQIYISPHF